MQKTPDVGSNLEYAAPDESGHFGRYGGRFVSETLIHALDQLESLYLELKEDPDFLNELAADMQRYVGRPSPLYFAERLTESVGGPRIYLKREDLNHTGAHKVNNTVGQALLAKRMGKAADHCRDGRRPARRGYGNRCCPSWAQV